MLRLLLGGGLVFLIGGGVGWLLHGTACSASPNTAVEIPLQSTPPPPVATHAQLESVPDTMREPLVAEVPSGMNTPLPLTVREAVASLTAAIRKNPIWDGSETLLAQKYEGLNVGELRAAYDVVKVECDRERQSIVDQKFKLGLYDVVSSGSNDAAPEIKTKPNGGPVSFGFRQEAQGSTVITKMTTISPDEYPAYRALELEWAWLDRQISSMSNH